MSMIHRLSAIALSVLFATNAAAATIDAEGVLSANASGQTVAIANAETSFGRTVSFLDFYWEATPYSAFISFTIDAGATASLVFAGYGDEIDSEGPSFDPDAGAQVFKTFAQTQTSRDVSGFTLDILDGANGSAKKRLTNDTNFCNGADPLIAGNCNLVGPEGGLNSNAFGVRGDTLVAGLSAGSYRLGLFDSATPVKGAALFDLIEIAPVPLPASGLMLIAALGMAGFAGRRRKS